MATYVHKLVSHMVKNVVFLSFLLIFEVVLKLWIWPSLKLATCIWKVRSAFSSSELVNFSDWHLLHYYIRITQLRFFHLVFSKMGRKDDKSSKMSLRKKNFIESLLRELIIDIIERVSSYSLRNLMRVKLRYICLDQFSVFNLIS